MGRGQPGLLAEVGGRTGFLEERWASLMCALVHTEAVGGRRGPWGDPPAITGLVQPVPSEGDTAHLLQPHGTT